ncbi:MAG: nitrite/sulfite reductase [Phycisphaerae bacterium]
MGAEQGIITTESGEKLNKVEALKRKKDGLAVWDDISRYAKEGFASITEEDLLRLRWFGLYQQQPNGGGNFMLRVRIPNGFLTAPQLREIGLITQEFARGFGDITTRQNIQLHWITIQSAPEVLRRLEAVGLVTKFACGDTPRNVVGCPLAGYLADEILDASGTVTQVNRLFLDADRELSNLPRKFKASIAGCHLHCHQPQINDIGAYGVKRINPASGKEEIGYGLVVGGGLSTTPHMAQGLRVFITPEQMPAVAKAVVTIFRDFGYREKRTHARLKFLVADWGWQKFRDQLEQTLGFALAHDDTLTGPPVAPHTDHVGIGAQKQPGLSYVGVPVERGRITAEQMLAAADLAAKYAGDKARIGLSNKQNLLLINIPTPQVAALSQELTAAGLAPQAPLWRTNLVSCTGTQFCNLAIVETKERAQRILKYLETQVPIDSPIFVSVTGCPNACAQYQIADIGLMGVVCNFRGVRGTEAYNVLLGGALGQDAQFAKPVLKKVPADHIHEAIKLIVAAYQKQRTSPAETFRAFVGRHTPEQRAAWMTIPEMAEVK